MNIERIEQLATKLEYLHEKDQEYLAKNLHSSQNYLSFSMNVWFFNCNTPSCIAGHTVYLFDKDMFKKTAAYHEFHDWVKEGAELLGLELDTARQLFVATNASAMQVDINAYPGDPGYVSAGRAARVLRHLVQTTIVNWNIQ